MVVETGLVVDGDAAFAARVSALLVDVAFEHAAGLGEARELLTQSSPRYLLLSAELADGDGIDLLPTVRRLRPEPLVAILHDGLSADRLLALHGQYVVAVPKPLSDQNLIDLIHLLRAADSLPDAVDRFAAQSKLSPQETRLLQLSVVQRLNNDEAAAELGCARPTVSTYWNRIFEKTGYHCARDVITSLVRHDYTPQASGVYAVQSPAVAVPSEAIDRRRGTQDRGTSW